MLKKCAVILNGEYYKREIEGGYIICADNGYDICIKKGIKPDVIIGDFDSISEYDKSIKIIKFPEEKDQTDGELALFYAINQGFNEINIYGGDGGRLDHIFANVSLLYQAHKLNTNAVLRTNLCDVYYTNKDFEINMEKNGLLSIVPFSDELHIMDTEGLKYKLVNASLFKGTTLGISNVAVSEKIKIKIDKGEALIFKIF